LLKASHEMLTVGRRSRDRFGMHVSDVNAILRRAAPDARGRAMMADL
jgi:hypothetical protein